MKHAKTHASSQLSEGDRTFFKLYEEYKRNGGDFGEEAKDGFRQALVKAIKNLPEPDPAQMAEIDKHIMDGLLLFIEDIKKLKLKKKKEVN